jgi:hypothetical protein
VVLTLQILQVTFFAIPILNLLIYGLIILIRPISVINRRLMLLIFLPLLLANLLAIWENDSMNDVSAIADWRLWLILVTDIVLGTGLAFGLRGVAIYGLTDSDAAYLFAEALRAKGFEVESHSGAKRSLLAISQTANILTVKTEKGSEDIWLTSRSGEVLVRVKTRQGLTILRKVVPLVRSTQSEYVFSAHAMGILYIVLGVVLAVLSWIFFFEPRLILIE